MDSWQEGNTTNTILNPGWPETNTPRESLSTTGLRVKISEDRQIDLDELSDQGYTSLPRPDESESG